MFRTHFFLSLVVALSLCTLAAANSLPVAMTSLHLQASAGMSGAATVVSHVSMASGNSAGVVFASVVFASANDRMPQGQNAQTIGLPLARVEGNLTAFNSTGITSTPRLHNNLRFRTETLYSGKGHEMSTPEPGSLLLLSSGLIGIAGMLRRKLAHG